MSDLYKIWITPRANGGFFQNAAGRLTSAFKATILEGRIDIVHGFSHDVRSKITDLPVEDGSVIADNVIDDPVKINIKAMVSNLHTDSRLLNKSGIIPTLDGYDPSGSVANFIQNRIENSGLEDFSYEHVEKGRPVAAVNYLLKLKKDRTLLSVASATSHYSNMIIESLSWNENFSTGESLDVSISMKQVIFAIPVVTRTYTIEADTVVSIQDTVADTPIQIETEEDISFYNSCITGVDPERKPLQLTEPPKILEEAP